MVEIDHIDMDSSNNLISNLRLATVSQNNCNKNTVKTKKTDLPKGINFSKSPGTKSGYMIARVYLEGKPYTKSGYDLNILQQWLEEKRTNLHEGFTNHG